MNKRKWMILGGVGLIVLVLVALIFLSGGSEKRLKIQPIAEDITRLQENYRLSDQGIITKQNLIRPLSGEPGTVLETEFFRLAYLPAPDVFEAEIKIIDTNTAKDSVIQFLKSRGMTEKDICVLPLIFYPDEALFDEMKAKNITFERLPSFCTSL